MCNPNYLNIAIETVLSLDIPDHLIPYAIADQARFHGQIDCETGFNDDWAISTQPCSSFQ